MQQYVIAELSARLEQLQAAAVSYDRGELARLRQQVETGPATGLALAMARAIALANGFCWQSLACGDVPAFERQAEIAADLHLFGICAHLLGDP
jgi:hypothetical protein